MTPRRVVAGLGVWMLTCAVPAAAQVSCAAGTHLERFGDAKKGEAWCVKDGGGGRHGPLHGWVRGFTIDGTFRDDKADGTFTGRWPNGQRAGEVVFRNGLVQGPLVAWHDNGRVFAECTFTDGKLSTPLVLFDVDGRRRAVFEPVAGGQLQLAHVWDATGREVLQQQRELKQVFPAKHEFFEWVMRHTKTRRAE